MQSTEIEPLRGRPVVAGIIAGMVAMAVTNILPAPVSTFITVSVTMALSVVTAAFRPVFADFGPGLTI